MKRKAEWKVRYEWLPVADKDKEEIINENIDLLELSKEKEIILCSTEDVTLQNKSPKDFLANGKSFESVPKKQKTSMNLSVNNSSQISTT